MRAVNLIPGVDSHDKGLPRLFSEGYESQLSQILPTYNYQHFTRRQMEIISGASSIIVNWPGVLQAQTPAASLSKIPQGLDPQILEAFITHAEADIAGAAGHINPHGSLTLNSPTFQSMRILRESVKQGGNPLTIYNNFLDGCAKEIYSLDVWDISDTATLGNIRAITRVANLLRTPNAEEFARIVETFSLIDCSETIVKGLGSTGIDDRAPNLEFLPALLIGIVRNHGLEAALKYLAILLEVLVKADSDTNPNDKTGMYEVNLERLARQAQKNELNLTQSPRFTLRRGIFIPL